MTGSSRATTGKTRTRSPRASIYNHEVLKTGNVQVKVPSSKCSSRHEKDSERQESGGEAHMEDAGRNATAHNSGISSPVARLMTGNISLHVPNSTDNARMKVPPCILQSSSRYRDSIESLTDGSIQPPVTVTTLQELDLAAIQNNLNLRIDICHDPDLFFQPISGQKGDAKRTEAKRYWSALMIEFQIYLHNAQPDCIRCRQPVSDSNVSFNPRLRSFFDNLRDIIQMLVPSSDHDEVANHLDTDFLMQQVQVAAMDSISLSKWLAKLLTSHCAPMRDASAAAVIEKISMGVTTADMEIFVEGLEHLFGLLEAMKLDIANHQIRSFRYHLINGTVEFQQDCFARAIESKQMNVTESQRWYRKQRVNHQLSVNCKSEESDEASQDFASFIHGLVHTCSPYEKSLPLTLQYDHHRITRLREDLQDYVQLNLCLGLFNQQVTEMSNSGIDSTTLHNELKRRIISLTEDEDGNGSAISEHLDAVAIEIVRASFSLRSPQKQIMFPLNSFDFNRATKTLREDFEEEDETQLVTASFLGALEQRTVQFVKQFNKMTTLEISNAQKHWTQARAGRDGLLAEWDEMARKLAHIAVVHWRIWKDLCYLNEGLNLHGSELDSQVIIEQEEKDTLSHQPLSALLSGEEYCMGVAQEMEFEQKIAAMHTMEPQVLRQDSGFAEISDGSPAQDADIDLDQGSGNTGSKKYKAASSEDKASAPRDRLGELR